jgi:hypothetical protein
MIVLVRRLHRLHTVNLHLHFLAPYIPTLQVYQRAISNNLDLWRRHNLHGVTNRNPDTHLVIINLVIRHHNRNR